MSDDAAFSYEPGAQTKRVRRPGGDPRQTSARRSAVQSGVYEPGALVAKRYQIRGALRCEPGVQVFKAVDQKSGTPVVLNVAFQSEERRRRLGREAEIAEAIRRVEPGAGAGFVLQRGWGSEAGLLFQVVDAIEGPRPLFSPTATVEARLGALAQLSRVVGELHRSEILHCNLQPGSCRLSADGRLFLGGFGLAVVGRGPHRTELGWTPSMAGTPSYVAPERLLGEEVDERADVYSLGTLLFQIICGELPYPGSLPAIVRAQTEVFHGARPPLPQGVDKAQNALARLCVKATQPDPALRPSTAVAILEALEAAGVDSSPALSPSGMGRKAGAASGRHPRSKVKPRTSKRMSRSEVNPRASGRHPRPKLEPPASERMSRSEVKPRASGRHPRSKAEPRATERMSRSDVRPRASERMSRSEVRPRATERMSRSEVRPRATERMVRPTAQSERTRSPVKPSAVSSSTGPLGVEPDPNRAEHRL
jgi:serine/threonine protein kinase